MAVLEEDVYQAWNVKYEEAATAITDRAQKLDEVAELVGQLWSSVYPLHCQV